MYRITRNLINEIIKGKGYYYLYREKSNIPLKISRSDTLDRAFELENWRAFERVVQEETDGRK